jgi:16S rRNA (uracil1498-N3)-methyltransferase
LLKSLRLCDGATVEGLSPGTEGERFLMRLEASGGRCALHAISSEKERPDRPEITLLIGLLKPGQFDCVLRASSELGVKAIIPLSCERSVPRIGDSDCGKKAARWQKILDEGTSVSGAASPPVIGPPAKFADVGWDSLPNFRCAAVISQSSPPISEISELPGEIAYAVGPEGDWSEAERAVLAEKKFAPVSLGRRTMRSSTAAIAGIAWFRLRALAG